MFKDNNIPDGFYGEVYRKETGSDRRSVTKPYYPFTQWESEVVRIALEEINKKLNLK